MAMPSAARRVCITIMALAGTFAQLSIELDMLSVHLREFAMVNSPLNSASQFSLRDECLLEGLLSRAWQAWCVFCRTCIINSCMGTVRSSGGIVSALPDAISESHVSRAGIYAKRKSNPPFWHGPPNVILRLEPTWGDVDVLTTILSRLRPTNFAQLQAAFSSGWSSAKALQLIRNGAAHNNIQNMAEIQKLRSGYIVFPISHPTHALFWSNPKSGDFLVLHALQELKDTGVVAIA